MISEISLIVIASVQLAFLVVLCIALFKVKKETALFYTEAKKTSTEVMKLLNQMNNWVESDLHKISTGAGDLIKKTSDYVAQATENSPAGTLLSLPLRLLSGVLPAKENREEKVTFPQVLKWVVQGFYLVKTTKEVLKNEH